MQVRQNICTSSTCTWLKKRREENLGPSVVLALTECLEDKYCTIFSDNYFNSPYLIIKLFGKGLYEIGAVRRGAVKGGDHEYQFAIQ